jgi:hypothetical protein
MDQAFSAPTRRTVLKGVAAATAVAAAPAVAARPTPAVFLFDHRFAAARRAAALASAAGAELVEVAAVDPAVWWREQLAPLVGTGTIRIAGLTPGAAQAIAALFARDHGFYPDSPSAPTDGLVRWSLARR